MPLFPAIPSLPSFPFSLPFNATVDLSHVLRLPEDRDDFSPCEVDKFFDCLITQPFPRQGCNWVIIANRKVYFVRWRDVSVRPPWTEQVWDLFRVVPPTCGCPSAPLGMGWQWSWASIIETIRCDVFRNWQQGPLEGPGGATVVVDTNYFQNATVSVPQGGPVLHLNAADSETVAVVAGAVERWIDTSTLSNDAVQPVAINRPTVDVASLNGLDTLRFNGSSQYLNLPTLRRRGDWHLFVVGRFFASVQPRGTFLGAMGFEAGFGGLEGKVYQDSSVRPMGTPFTFVYPSEVAMIGTVLGSGVFGVWEWRESVAVAGSVGIGINAFDQSVFTGNTSDDYWDPTRETFGQPVPLPGSVGRSNWGVNPARAFDYLNGSIGEVLLYPRVLPEGERTQVLNVLRARWNLGAPLPIPA